VFPRPESVPLWIEAGAGRPNWEALFAEFNAAVDYPSAAFWRELAEYYPNAKVIHTVRDPDKWFDSTQATIFNPNGPMAMVMQQDEASLMASFFRSFTKPFISHIHDRAFMTDFFKRHSESVLATIAPERLLVYEAGQGWEPLCAFLGVPVPDAPYPSENTTADFQARFGAQTS
jgi:hypothetical protein